MIYPQIPMIGTISIYRITRTEMGSYTIIGCAMGFIVCYTILHLYIKQKTNIQLTVPLIKFHQVKFVNSTYSEKLGMHISFQTLVCMHFHCTLFFLLSMISVLR